MTDTTARAQAGWRDTFGAQPAGLWAAPGRVNLIGEHTDYNDGFVLPFALPQRTVVAAAPADTGWTVASEFDGWQPISFRGEPGEVYNVGGPDEATNIEVVKGILRHTGKDESLIEYVTDRPGHDRRYSLGSEKARALGWSAQVRFEEGLEKTVAWYRDNAWWWEPIRSGEYREYYERHYGRSLG